MLLSSRGCADVQLHRGAVQNVSVANGASLCKFSLSLHCNMGMVCGATG